MSDINQTHGKGLDLPAVPIDSARVTVMVEKAANLIGKAKLHETISHAAELGYYLAAVRSGEILREPLGFEYDHHALPVVVARGYGCAPFARHGKGIWATGMALDLYATRRITAALFAQFERGANKPMADGLIRLLSSEFKRRGRTPELPPDAIARLPLP